MTKFIGRPCSPCEYSKPCTYASTTRSRTGPVKDLTYSRSDNARLIICFDEHDQFLNPLVSFKTWKVRKISRRTWPECGIPSSDLDNWLRRLVSRAVPAKLAPTMAPMLLLKKKTDVAVATSDASTEAAKPTNALVNNRPEPNPPGVMYNDSHILVLPFQVTINSM